jgi:hypothetical protein
LALALATLVSGSACVDLFHATDYETLCGLDASAPGCPPPEGGRMDARRDAADAAPLDFCSLSQAEALEMATHACAWLGACSVPFDQNAFGPCVHAAILAFDCAANPNQPIAPGPLHDLWQALGSATSCAEVSQAINPDNASCDTTGFGCAGSVAVECFDGGGGGAESCLMEGRVCAGAGSCVPKGALSTCKKSKCELGVLHDCEGSSDLGYDCTNFGAGLCVESDAGASCQPKGSHTCAETFDVTCSSGGSVARACPGGQSVQIDCAHLNAKCKPGTPMPLWNVAGQCQSSGSCVPGCSGSGSEKNDTLEGCAAEGPRFTTSCKHWGLGPCQEVKLPAGEKGYACGAPR